MESPDQTCQIEPRISDSESVLAPRGNPGFPPYHFVLSIDLMWTWTICPALIAHVLLCSLIGGLHYQGTHKKSLCFLSQQPVPYGFLDNGWMWAVHLVPKTVGHPSSRSMKFNDGSKFGTSMGKQKYNCLSHLANCCICGRCSVVIYVPNQSGRSGLVGLS